MSAESQDPLSWLLEKLLELLRGGESKYGGVPVMSIPPELVNQFMDRLAPQNGPQAVNGPEKSLQDALKPHPLLDGTQQFDGADKSRRPNLNDNPKLDENDTAQNENALRNTPTPRPGPAVTPELKLGK